MTFWIPLTAPAAPVEPGPEEQTRSALVVDDEVDVRELVAEILEVRGHVVMLAASGREGLERLGTQRYDLVITDLGMPGSQARMWPRPPSSATRPRPCTPRRLVGRLPGAAAGA